MLGLQGPFGRFASVEAGSRRHVPLQIRVVLLVLLTALGARLTDEHHAAEDILSRETADRKMLNDSASD